MFIRHFTYFVLDLVIKQFPDHSHIRHRVAHREFLVGLVPTHRSAPPRAPVADDLWGFSHVNKRLCLVWVQTTVCGLCEYCEIIKINRETDDKWTTITTRVLYICNWCVNNVLFFDIVLCKQY